MGYRAYDWYSHIFTPSLQYVWNGYETHMNNIYLQVHNGINNKYFNTRYRYRSPPHPKPSTALITPIRLGRGSAAWNCLASGASASPYPSPKPWIVQLTKQPNCRRYTNLLATDAWIIIHGWRWRESAAQKQKMPQIQILVVVVVLVPRKMLHAARVESEIRRGLWLLLNHLTVIS